jgi:23S rRNA pseudouridine1911/1915/1917 synthase
LEPEDIPLDIVFEDESLIVVEKPKGMVVHPAHGNETGTLVNGLLAHILQNGGSLSAINGEIRPGIVHRIDKDTSGLLVIAKTDFAHQNLSAQLASHSMKRIYHAIVSGGFREDDGTIDVPIGRDPKDRKKQKVRPEGGGRYAITHYHVMERFSSATLLEVRLETGRTHQIRVHMASCGHPILGDELYGKGKGGQYLHAGTLGFIHPVTQEYMEFTKEFPETFQVALEKLRKR